MTLALISTVTVGAGGAASIEFTGIPQTGTDLMIVLSGRDTVSNYWSSPLMTINGETSGTSMLRRALYAASTTVASVAEGSVHYFNGFLTLTGATTAADTYGSSTTYIANYSSTSVIKSISFDGVSENNNADAAQNITAGRWNSTAAVTSIKFVTSSGNNFAQYSRASLYTITKGSGGATVA